jgi:exocyst complex component 2
MNPVHSSTTICLKHSHAFQTYAATSAYKIAGGIDISATRTVAKQTPIGRDFANKISKAFIDTLYAILDGLEKLSRPDYAVPSFAKSLGSLESAIPAVPSVTTTVDPSNVVSSSKSRPFLIAHSIDS